MQPKIGQIYQKHKDRRLILDTTDTQVFYEELFNKSVGTIVEHDSIKHQKQIGIKAWRKWVETATLEMTYYYQCMYCQKNIAIHHTDEHREKCTHFIVPKIKDGD